MHPLRFRPGMCLPKPKEFADERMAQEGIARLEEMFADPEAYRAMRRAAHAQARALFNPEDAAAYWDGLYERAAAG